MKSLAMLREAWRSLGANRLRTVLTMLGMVIGVAAVILMLAIGRGAQNQVNRADRLHGQQPAHHPLRQHHLRRRCASAPATRRPSRSGDAEAIARTARVQAVAPIAPGGARSSTASTTGAPGHRHDARVHLASATGPSSAGEAFTEPTCAARRGWRCWARPWPRTCSAPRTRSARRSASSGQPFKVLGVLKKKGQSLDGRDQDDTVLVPVTTAQRKLFGNRFPGTVRFIMVQAVEPGGDAAPPRTTSTQLLRQRHRIRPGQDDDFTVRNLTQVAEPRPATARDHVAAAGRHRLHLAAGRRHRHHEHHAGVGDRAHARDRHPHGHRRAPARHPAAVPARGAHDLHRRRPGRHRPRRGRRASRSARPCRSRSRSRRG